MNKVKTIMTFVIALSFFLSESIVLPSCAEARGKSGYRTSQSSSSRSGSVSVRGHVTKRGTYVAPHRRTTPNKSKRDNWSIKGNVNPYTGKKGSKKEY